MSLGAEEKKAGLKGSSTRSLVLSGAAVPKENLLGEVGRGFAIAFGTLNVGRLKLATANAAAARFALTAAVEYGRNRTAFGRPITDFGLVKDKVAQMAILAYAAEAVVYRTTAAIDRIFDAADDDPASALKRIEDLEVECSTAKVWCSEALDYAARRECPDLRCGRLRRGLPCGTALARRPGQPDLRRDERAQPPADLEPAGARRLRGDLPLGDAEAGAADRADPGQATADDGFLARERQLLAAAKRVALLCLGALTPRYQQALDGQQELLGHLADVTIETYAFESALLRARKWAKGRAAHESRLQEAAVRCLAQDALNHIDVAARRLLSAVEEGEPSERLLQRLRALTERHNRWHGGVDADARRCRCRGRRVPVRLRRHV